MYEEAFKWRSPNGKCASNVFLREGWITPEHQQDYKTLKLPHTETRVSTCWINVQTTAGATAQEDQADGHDVELDGILLKEHVQEHIYGQFKTVGTCDVLVIEQF